VSRASPHRNHSRKKLEGVRPIRRVAGRSFYERHLKRSFYERHLKRSFCERHPKRRKSRPRLRRRRLRPSKQRILTAARPPRNLCPALPPRHACCSAAQLDERQQGEGSANTCAFRSREAASRTTICTKYIRKIHIKISLAFQFTYTNLSSPLMTGPTCGCLCGHPAVLAKGGKRAMVMKSGERWHCVNPACGWRGSG
jgi:hypothetical protein